MSKRLIKLALHNLSEEMSREANAARRSYEESGGKGPNYFAGLHSEGYVGGYRDALNDCLLAMNKVTPQRRGWWEKKSTGKGR